MSNRYRRPARAPERGGLRGCLVSMVVLIWVVLGLLLAYQYILRSRVSNVIGQQITQRLGGSASTSGAPTAITIKPEGQGASSGDATQPTTDQAVSAASGAIPTFVAALPNGDIKVTEDEANTYVAQHIAEFAPIEAITLHFHDGEAEADLRAFGTSSTMHTGIGLQNGQVVTVNPRIDGPLAALIDLEGVIGPLQERLNRELTTQGRTITNVKIEQGVIIFTVES